jgi:hypothetical protein
MSGVLPPFSLPSGVVLFHDWRYVDHGYQRYLDTAGQPVGLWAVDGPPPPVHGSDEWLPRGLRLEVVPGQVDPEPLLRATERDEVFLLCGSVIASPEGYELYYESTLPDALRPEWRHHLHQRRVLRRATSPDGRRWSPAETVFAPTATGLHGAAVSRDPHGPPAERYKAMWMGMVNAEQLARYRQRWPDDVDPMALLTPQQVAHQGFPAWGMWGAVSPDGRAWRLLEEPLLLQHSDTFNAFAWDPLAECYVAYPRTWYYGRRAVGRVTSPDFRHFGGLQQVLWPDPGMAPDETWYTPGYTTPPDAPDYRLLFASLWGQWDDAFTPVLHSSADGILWQRVPGGPTVPHGPPGSWYACGAPITTLVPLPGDRMGCLAAGWHVPHKFPRALPGFGQLGWVSWQRDRLAGLRADTVGQCSLFALHAPGRRLLLNYHAEPTGSVAVALRAEGATGPERTFATCDVLTGDATAREVTWQGQADLGVAPGTPIRLSLRLQRATVYSLRWAP